MEDLRRPAGVSDESGQRADGNGRESHSRSDGQTDPWFTIHRLAKLELGLSPNQLAEYTDNDILEEVYRRRQERKLHSADMEVQAWDIFLAVSRIMSKDPVSFDSVFPHAHREMPTDLENTKKVCKAHGMNLLEV